LGCSPASFVVAMMDSARCGLEPNGKDAALVPYGQDCQFRPMFQGLIKQAVQGGAAKKINARIVYANDKFKLKYDPEPHIEHEPAYDDEGEVVGAYAYAVLPDGTLHVEYMNKRQLDHIKAKSKSSSGPWSTDPEEMYRKTPVKRLFKYLPVPDEVEYAVQVDNLAENGRSRDDIPLLDKTPEDLKVPQTEAVKEKLKRGRPAKPQETAQEAPAPEAATTEQVSPEVAPSEASESAGVIPKAVTEAQLVSIRYLIQTKGYDDNVILDDFQISALDELTQEAAENVIDRLKGLPNALDSHNGPHLLLRSLPD
jgi:recombinational DNA repair protein RecT